MAHISDEEKLNLRSENFDPLFSLQHADRVSIPVSSAKLYDTTIQCAPLLPQSDEFWHPPKARRIDPSAPYSATKVSTAVVQLPTSTAQTHALSGPKSTAPPTTKMVDDVIRSYSKFGSDVGVSACISNVGPLLLCPSGGKNYVNTLVFTHLRDSLLRMPAARILQYLQSTTLGRSWLQHYMPGLLKQSPSAGGNITTPSTTHKLIDLPLVLLHSLARQPCPVHSNQGKRKSSAKASKQNKNQTTETLDATATFSPHSTTFSPTLPSPSSQPLYQETSYSIPHTTIRSNTGVISRAIPTSATTTLTTPGSVSGSAAFTPHTLNSFTSMRSRTSMHVRNTPSSTAPVTSDPSNSSLSTSTAYSPCSSTHDTPASALPSSFTTSSSVWASASTAFVPSSIPSTSSSSSSSSSFVPPSYQHHSHTNPHPPPPSHISEALHQKKSPTVHPRRSRVSFLPSNTPACPHYCICPPTRTDLPGPFNMLQLPPLSSKKMSKNMENISGNGANVKIRVVLTGSVPALPKILSESAINHMFPEDSEKVAKLLGTPNSPCVPLLGAEVGKMYYNQSGNPLPELFLNNSEDLKQNSVNIPNQPSFSGFDGYLRCGRQKKGVRAVLEGTLLAYDHFLNIVVGDVTEYAWVWVDKVDISDAIMNAHSQHSLGNFPIPNNSAKDVEMSVKNTFTPPPLNCIGVWTVASRSLSRLLVRGQNIVSIHRNADDK